MAGTDCLLAIGSQNHVSLVDPRVKACVSSFANAEHNHGMQGITGRLDAYVHSLQQRAKMLMI